MFGLDATPHSHRDWRETTTSSGSLPSVSVVVPTFRRRDRIMRALAPLLDDPHVDEVIVVVDGSDDGTLELLQDVARTHDRLRPIWQTNSGPETARQTGLDAARSEVVLFLDDDVMADPGLGFGHARAHAQTRGALVVGYMPTVRPQQRRPGNFTATLYADEYERFCASWTAEPDSIINTLWGGNYSMRRDDAVRVGVSGTLNLARVQDREFGMRCAEAGLSAVFDRTLSATHEHERDLAGYFREYHIIGDSRRRLGELYPARLGTFDPRDDLSVAQRLLVGTLAAHGVRKLSRAVLYHGCRLAGRLHVWPVELALGRLLRQVELIRGFEGDR
ncbi:MULTISPECIES: glycosyltransferase family 2 protein [unclassified Mycobacterium]|uniref:glycosyltransferase family 2 protein n=1 Tax=unclassified Mycobacterium TaxID=2642494 RepID=UPI0029C800A1|nr:MULTISPECIES: glycosyltransferase family 2 protein [unclassified Mycobacterium]